MARRKLTPAQLEGLRLGRVKNVNDPSPAQVQARTNHRIYTRLEVLEHEALVEQALTAGASMAIVGRLLKAKFGVGLNHARKLVNRTLDKWAVESEKHRATNKASAEARLMSDARNARAEKKWSAAVQAEHLLADIQGTREPIKIDVDVRVGEAMVALVASMSGAELERIALEAEEKDRFWREHHPDVIDVQGVLMLPKLNGAGGE